MPDFTDTSKLNLNCPGTLILGYSESTPTAHDRTRLAFASTPTLRCPHCPPSWSFEVTVMVMHRPDYIFATKSPE